jgi:hypothetical protein
MLSGACGEKGSGATDVREVEDEGRVVRGVRVVLRKGGGCG